MIIGGSASQDLAAHVARELGEEVSYVETKVSGWRKIFANKW